MDTTTREPEKKNLKMVQCCKCNRTGQCKGCVCVKAGRYCSNCLPSKLGSCSNVLSLTRPRTPLPTAPAPAPAPPTAIVPNVTLSAPTGPTGPLLSASSTPTPPVVSLTAVPHGVSISCPPLGIDTSTPTPNPTLPAFNPMAEPNFTWGG